MGSQNDDHGCVSDGGYQWCESLNRCVRPWLSPCPSTGNVPVIDPMPVPVVDPLPPTPTGHSLPPPPPPPPSQHTNIPLNCASWYDGCNHCMVRNGQVVGCTRMMCVTQNTPRCLAYNTLKLGDICYRFCEDNSEPLINLMNNCPQDSICTHRPTTVGYDSCGSNAWRCVQSH